MTPEIAVTLIIVIIAIILFVTEKLRVDLIALLVLGSLVVTRLLTPEQALSGFSNPAVITVWAVFILGGGLSRTGVASFLGQQVIRLAGTGQVRLLVIIMLTAGILSAFMNNVGVVAMLLPVIMDISRKTELSPSRLLMPMAIASLLGGMMSLIGTPTNILASDAIRDAGLGSFGLFDFTPVGLGIILVGTAFFVLIGRHLLPTRQTLSLDNHTNHADLEDAYQLQKHLFLITLPTTSTLVGKTLIETRLGAALGLHVIAITRAGKTQLAPPPETALEGGDRLLVAGSFYQIEMLQSAGQTWEISPETIQVERLSASNIELVEIKLASQARIIGSSLKDLDFRNQYQANVLAIRREGKTIEQDIHSVSLEAHDTLLLQTTHEMISQLRNSPNFQVSERRDTRLYQLDEDLLAVRIPPSSTLVGKTLADSKLGEAFDLKVLGIIHDGETKLMPEPSEQLNAGDTLLVKGRLDTLKTIQEFHTLRFDQQTVPSLKDLETEQIGLMEAVLSPRTTLAGKTLHQLHFREKYGLQVLAIMRSSHSFRKDLRDIPLRFGDALLLFGPRARFDVLKSETDLILLTEELQLPPRVKKAPLAAGIMLLVILTVILGWFPISIAAVIGGALMVLTGSLEMDEAYSYINWRAVFLIAGMLPLGIAMDQTGTASYLANAVVRLVGHAPPSVLAGSLFLMTMAASQFMPNPVVMVLMAPVALSAAANLAISPYALIMATAIGASSSFLSPVAHPSNVLIMGPGGYRFSDYIKIGLPLMLVVMITTLLLLPVFWPY